MWSDYAQSDKGISPVGLGTETTDKKENSVIQGPGLINLLNYNVTETFKSCRNHSIQDEL